MERTAQFVRSVMPRDFWQLVFLFGVIFLFISPRLPWSAPKTIDSYLQEAVLAPQANENSRLEWARFVAAMIWPINFAGLAAYFTCFWSGNRPARRIVLGVIIPTVFALALIAHKFVQLAPPSTSVFATPRARVGNHLEFLANILHLPPAPAYVISGLLMISVFTLQLLRGKSSLPLALPDGVVARVGLESWPRVKILIFILVAPLYLLTTLFSLPLLFAYAIPAHFRSPIYGPMVSIAADILGATLLVIAALWVLGKSAKVDIRRSLQLPEPRYAFFAALISIGACFSIPAAECLFDRVRWVEHGIGTIDAPILANYFNPAGLADPWLLLLLFGAFAEEIVFRGVLLPRALQRYGLERGILLTGLIWAAYHFRGDSYSGLSVGGVFLRLGHRIILCVALNYVFAWMTLRWRSIIPAAVAHSVWNVLATSGVGGSHPWSSDFALISWTIIAMVLYRFWPLPKRPDPEPEFLAVAQTLVS